MLYQTALFFHFAAIMLIGGGSISAILGEKQLWQKINNGSENAKQWVSFIQSATIFVFAGMILFLVSGIILLYAVDWMYLRQPWFITKLACFLLLPVRGALIGRRTVAVLDKQLGDKNYNKELLLRSRSKMNRFHSIQFILVAAIILLVIFKWSF